MIPGRPPEPDQVPVGCAFAARCPLATERCLTEDPVLERAGDGHGVACWHPHETAVSVLSGQSRKEGAA